jgi:hypothetical protein
MSTLTEELRVESSMTMDNMSTSDELENLDFSLVNKISLALGKPEQNDNSIDEEDCNMSESDDDPWVTPS